MTNTVHKVTLSVDGNHSVSVHGDDPVEVQESLAWAKGIYLKLPAGPMEKGGGHPRGAPPLCELHQVPMIWQQGRKGYFWSCHEKNADGSWCDYKPIQG